MTTDPIPNRDGPRPQVIGPRPHAQRSQNAPPELQNELIRRALELPGVSAAESRVSVPGARAFVLDEVHALGPSLRSPASIESLSASRRGSAAAPERYFANAWGSWS
jgi:hypothetical protein